MGVRAEVREAMLRRAGYQCEKCGGVGVAPRGSRTGLEVHHRTAPRDGGGDEPENLQVLCTRCHPRGRPSRPALGGRHTRTLLLTEQDNERIRALAEHWGCSAAAAVRRSVRETAKREGVE